MCLMLWLIPAQSTASSAVSRHSILWNLHVGPPQSFNEA